MKFNPKYILLGVTLLLISSLLYYFSQIVSYVLIAWAISMIGAPIVVSLRKYIGKNMAALVTLFLFFAVLVLLFWMFLPPLISQAENLAKVDYNRVVNSFEEPIKDWESWLVKNKLMIDRSSEELLLETENSQDPIRTVVIDSIRLNDKSGVISSLKIDINLKYPIPEEEENSSFDGDFFEMIKFRLNEYFNPLKIRELFSNTMAAFGNVLVGLFSIFFIGFFFLREQGLFDKILASIVPTQYEVQTLHAVDESSKLLIRYLIGILLQVTIITFIVSVGLTFFGVKNALLIGFLAGLINVIPYLGPIIGFVIGVMITMSSHMDLSFYNQLIPLLMKVAGVFAFMQFIDNVLLQPIIFSKSVKAHPLEIFIIVMVGAQLGGILGMVLAIPSYTVFRVVGRVFFSEFKVINALTKNM